MDAIVLNVHINRKSHQDVACPQQNQNEIPGFLIEFLTCGGANSYTHVAMVPVTASFSIGCYET